MFSLSGFQHTTKSWLGFSIHDAAVIDTEIYKWKIQDKMQNLSSFPNNK